MALPPLPLSAWSDAIRARLARGGATAIDRVVVVAETASTQDAARSMAGGRPGLVVVGGRQTAGRGRFGRRWAQGDGGLAMTVVLDAARADAARLSLACGVALARALGEIAPSAAIGLRWPNDAVEREGGRKVAGVLIERAGAVFVVGFGVNVGQGAKDWPEDLRGRAVSLAELGAAAEIPDVAGSILVVLDRAIALPGAALAEEWRRHDTLVGRHATFTAAGDTVSGVVESIDPAHSVTLRLADGSRRVLDAATASLVDPLTIPPDMSKED